MAGFGESSNSNELVCKIKVEDVDVELKPEEAVLDVDLEEDENVVFVDLLRAHSVLLCKGKEFRKDKPQEMEKFIVSLAIAGFDFNEKKVLTKIRNLKNRTKEKINHNRKLENQKQRRLTPSQHAFWGLLQAMENPSLTHPSEILNSDLSSSRSPYRATSINCPSTGVFDYRSRTDEPCGETTSTANNFPINSEVPESSYTEDSSQSHNVSRSNAAESKAMAFDDEPPELQTLTTEQLRRKVLWEQFLEAKEHRLLMKEQMAYIQEKRKALGLSTSENCTYRLPFPPSK